MLESLGLSPALPKWINKTKEIDARNEDQVHYPILTRTFVAPTTRLSVWSALGEEETGLEEEQLQAGNAVKFYANKLVLSQQFYEISLKFINKPDISDG